MLQKEMKMKKEIIKELQINYLLYLPKDYDGRKKFPMILFLHGAGEKGNDLELLKTYGLPQIIENTDDFPFIVVSPQCPGDRHWGLIFDEVYALLQEIKNEYAVDFDRIYLTGLSMGGFGTWGFASRHPEEFAAIAPLCGGWMINEEVLTLKDTPVWAFHGEKDNVVPIEMARTLVELLESHNGNVKFTVFPEADHDLIEFTYAKNDLYDWLLLQKKNQI